MSIEDMAWVPSACALPSAERPARLAEFEAVFAEALTGVERREPGWLRLRFRDGVEARLRDLTAREAACCGFFDFTVHHAEGEVVVDVRVPADKTVVLDGIAAQAAGAGS